MKALASVVFAVFAAFAACDKSDSSGGENPAQEPTQGSKEPAPTDKPAEPGEVIAWVHDDYSAALEKAKADDKPLVIDMSAPWCHTCLSMQHTTLADKGLEVIAKRFVWLEIDTDKEVNAGALAKFPVSAWPTYFVVSPENEAIQARFVGAASVKQFREFLIQGEKGHAETQAEAGKLTRNSLGWIVRDGDQKVVAGDYKGAAASYGAAVGKAPSDWPRMPDVLVSQISALSKAKAYPECVDLAVDSSDKIRIGNTGSACDFAYYAEECAGELKDPSKQKLVRARMLESVDKVLAATDSALSMDDRSECLRIKREIFIAEDRKDDAKKVADEQRELLDRAAAGAKTPFEAMTYNWPRAEVYVYLGIPDKLVADLKKSVEDLPEQYDPPYRLAWIYFKLGKHGEALKMANQALEKVYGPRKGRVQSLVADIYEAKGDKAAAQKARQAVVDIYEKLPEGQKNERALEAAKKKLAESS